MPMVVLLAKLTTKFVYFLIKIDNISWEFVPQTLTSIAAGPQYAKKCTIYRKIVKIAEHWGLCSQIPLSFSGCGLCFIPYRAMPPDPKILKVIF